MPDDSPWTGVTHRHDDLRVTGADDGGEPTAALPPVRPDADPAPPPAGRASMTGPNPAVDDDEVPFWLLPAPPRPSAAGPRQRPPTAPPAIGPDAPDERPPLADRLFAGGMPNPTRVVEVGGAGPVQRRSARTGSATPATALLGRSAVALAQVRDRIADTARGAPSGWLVAAVAAAVALVVVLVSLAAFGGGGEPAARPSPSPSGTPTKVDAALVTATASSTQDPAGKTTYDAANTLDGKPSTAWNSHGGADGPGPGITLTYSFERPVDLRTITVTNGYQKTVTRSGTKVDLFAANSRLKRVRVITDGGRWTWDLKDGKTPQPFRKGFGTTSALTIEIVSVYKGSRYSDVAVSDVTFSGVVPKA